MTKDTPVPDGELSRVANQVLASAGTGFDDDLFVRHNEERLRESSD